MRGEANMTTEEINKEIEKDLIMDEVDAAVRALEKILDKDSDRLDYSDMFNVYKGAQELSTKALEWLVRNHEASTSRRSGGALFADWESDLQEIFTAVSALRWLEIRSGLPREQLAKMQMLLGHTRNQRDAIHQVFYDLMISPHPRKPPEVL